MADYIDRNKAINALEYNNKVFHYADSDKENIVLETVDKLCQVLCEMPAADVQPVKHGRWIDIYEYCKALDLRPTGLQVYYWCSECDKAEKKTSDFCPNCGADMIGG